MITKIKKVYYCEHCKKHYLNAGAMAHHEKHCTANPNRECRLCGGRLDLNEIKFQIKRMQKKNKFFNAKDIMDFVDSCPMCTFSIIRQLKWHRWPFNQKLKFNFKEELSEWWAMKNADDQYMYGIGNY